MKTAATRTISLDTDDAVALFAAVFGGPGADAQTLEVRIRYLQKMPFPDDERAGRGKRTVHDTTNIMKLLTVLALMDMGVTAARATVTVRAFWPLFAATLADAWVDVRTVDRRRKRIAKLLLLEVADLFDPDGAIRIETAFRSDLPSLLGATSGLVGRIVLNPSGLLSALRDAMIEVHRYRDDEVAVAFDKFAAASGAER